MNLNWGWGIALFYTTFAVAMLTMAFKTTKYDHSLVREDYYQADIAYQEQYDKLVNQQAGILAISHSAGSAHVLLKTTTQNTETVKGEVKFFRPNNAALDFSVPVELDPSGQQQLPLEDLASGRWKVQVDYQVAGTPYFTETEIFR